MRIDSVRHEALRRFIETGQPRGVSAAGHIADMIAFILGAGDIAELAVPPNFGFHPLRGDRARWFAMAVTRNWRLTFRHIEADLIGDLDLEDDH